MKYAYIYLDQWLVAEGFKHDARQLADIYAPMASVLKVGDIHDEGQMDVDSLCITDTQEFRGSKDVAVPNR